MGRRDGEHEGTSDSREPIEDGGPFLVITGWILIIVGLVWAWMVFFASQSEIGLGVAGALAGLGYALQRAGNQSA